MTKNNEDKATIRKKDRLFEENLNNYGSKMIIVKYNSATDILVRFENNQIVKTSYSLFLRGSIKSYSCRTVYGVGCLGELFSNSKEQSYTIWRNMMRRCYFNNSKENPSYVDTVVCDEWHNYSNFKKWFNEAYYIFKSDSLELDKDLIGHGNIYSPTTCCFLPKKINMLLETRRDNAYIPYGIHKRGELYYVELYGRSKIHKHKSVHASIDDALEKYKEVRKKILIYNLDGMHEKLPENIILLLKNYNF